MRKFILVFLGGLLLSLNVFADQDLLKQYRNTTWVLDKKDIIKIEVKFGMTDATIYIYDYDNNKKLEIYADTLKHVLATETEGVNANQERIDGHNKGQLVFGLYIANENCLLQPDNEAPGGCLTKVEKEKSSTYENPPSLNLPGRRIPPP